MQIEAVPQAGTEFWARVNGSLKTQSEAIQKATFAIAEILSEISTVSPASKLQAYLVQELGLFGADAAGYIALAKLPATERVAVQELSIPFSTLKTLSRQPASVRTKAPCAYPGRETVIARRSRIQAAGSLSAPERPSQI